MTAASGGTSSARASSESMSTIEILVLLLSLEGLLSSTGIENPADHFCKACFDGCYPVQFDKNLSKHCMEIS